MAETESYSIRKTFLLPLGLMLAEAVALLVVCTVKGEPTAKLVILGGVIVVISVIFVESAFRRVAVGSEGVTAYRLLRRKTLPFAEITAVESVLVRKRAFLTLCAGDDFLILSNAYGDFPALVKSLLARVPPGTISPETHTMAAAPPMKSSDIVSCWVGAALLAFILYVQLGGPF